MPSYRVSFCTTGWIALRVMDAENEADAIKQAKAGDDGEHVIYDGGEHLNVFDPEVELDDAYDETADEEAARAELRGAGPEIDNLA